MTRTTISPRNTIWSCVSKDVVLSDFLLSFCSIFQKPKTIYELYHKREVWPSYMGGDFCPLGQTDLGVPRCPGMSGAGWRWLPLTKALNITQIAVSPFSALFWRGRRGVVAIYSNNCLSKHWVMQSLGKASLEETFVYRQSSSVCLKAAGVRSASTGETSVCLLGPLCLKTKDSFEVREGRSESWGALPRNVSRGEQRTTAGVSPPTPSPCAAEAGWSPLRASEAVTWQVKDTSSEQHPLPCRAQ